MREREREADSVMTGGDLELHFNINIRNNISHSQTFQIIVYTDSPYFL